MSEARPLDLNYGHLGEPRYDSIKHEWQFSRVPHITRQLSPLEKPSRALPPTRKHSVEYSQGAVRRSRAIKELTGSYPELQAATPILSGFAQVSEAVNNISSVYEPTVSELLALGHAEDSTSRRNVKRVPIIATTGGSAGEVVKLVRLNEERLAWGKGEKLSLRRFSCKDCAEALWMGNGSPIQQLVFAEVDGQPSPWLAIRYYGGVSILNPQFRQAADFAKLPLRSDLGSQIYPNPVIELSIERSRRVQFADVAFHPQDNQQFATIDQGGYWSIWNVRNIDSQRGIRMIEKGLEGHLLNELESEDHTQSDLLGDGWGVIQWVGSSGYIFTASREHVSIFGLQSDAKKLDVPDLFSRKRKDWILDVKKRSSDDASFLVLTSSTLYWLRLTASNDSESERIDAHISLAWKHFMDSDDTSLSLNILNPPEDSGLKSDNAVMKILLFSRASGLTLVYQFARSINDEAISTSDPFLLSIANTDQADGAGLNTGKNLIHRSIAISNIVTRALPFEFNYRNPRTGLGQTYLNNNVSFFQVSILYRDLSVSECLYADHAAGSAVEVQMPRIRSHKHESKTPSIIVDDFIASDSLKFTPLEEPHSQNVEQRLEQAALAKTMLSNQDARSISFEWLQRLLRTAIDQSMEVSPGAFDGVLRHLSETIQSLGATEPPKMEILLEMNKRMTSIGDVDAATIAYKDFLDDTARRKPREEDSVFSDIDERLTVSNMLTAPIWKSLDLADNGQIADIHDCLIKAYISPLSHKVPSRTRHALERLFRNLAGRICLASHSANPGPAIPDEPAVSDEASPAGAKFVLPVRRRASISNLPKGKQPATRTPSPHSTSSPPSRAIEFSPSSSFRALPTPEPTPSLRSQSSMPSFEEDPSVQRLQMYCHVEPKHALSIPFIDHWQIGGDPADYNPEAAQQAFASDEDEEFEEHAKKRERAENRRKRRRELTAESLSQPMPKLYVQSQPDPIRGGTQDSSQASRAILIASQDEPGEHGGHQGRKSNKKKAIGLKPGKLRRPGF
ncbi:hypothetical protein ACLMJK_007334 [Lecanora helva]